MRTSREWDVLQRGTASLTQLLDKFRSDGDAAAYAHTLIGTFRGAPGSPGAPARMRLLRLRVPGPGIGPWASSGASEGRRFPFAAPLHASGVHFSCKWPRQKHRWEAAHLSASGAGHVCPGGTHKVPAGLRRARLWRAGRAQPAGAGRRDGRAPVQARGGAGCRVARGLRAAQRAVGDPAAPLVRTPLRVAGDVSAAAQGSRQSSSATVCV